MEEKKMNIEFIKYVLLKAGFRIVKDDDGDEYVCYCEPEKRWCSIESLVKDPVLWPYALQRAIEGVNEKNIDIAEGFYIEQMTGQISVCLYDEPYVLFENKPIDKAKESALLYICNQEKSNGSI